jgi:diguanylate cyclase (GGDEF)-like protein
VRLLRDVVTFATRDGDRGQSRGAMTRWRYTVIGFLLGFGAPAGAFALRLALMADVRRAPFADLRTNAFFYAYSLVGTCIVFAVAGYIAGTHAERLRRAEEFYHRLAEHDPLTSLLNARAFEDRYRRTVERAARLASPVALLVIDVDNLKRINDEQGHERGSAALIRVADAIRAGKRGSDAAARWGGDEFAVLLDGAGATAARRTAETIMHRLAADQESSPAVTVTIGVAASVPREGASDLFTAADAALYEGKRAGRNQIRVAG